MRTREDVIDAFTPKHKLSEGQKQRMLRLEVLMKETATEVLDLVPECADRTAALRKMLEAKRTLTQAITHSQSPEEALLKTQPARPLEEPKTETPKAKTKE